MFQESSSCSIHPNFSSSSPPYCDDDESSLMEIDVLDEENGLELLKRKYDSFSNAKNSLKNSPIDAKNKGICTSCVLTPFQSNNINSNYAIKEKGETSTRFCVICNDIKPSKEMKEAGKCNHYFCVECIKDYLSKILKESRTLQVKCPEKDCKKILPNDFKEYFPQELIDRCNVSEVEARVLAWPKFVWCPFEDCYKVFVDDMKDYLIRACPKCWRVFCMKCRANQFHLGMTCYEFQRLNWMKRMNSNSGYC